MKLCSFFAANDFGSLLNSSKSLVGSIICNDNVFENHRYPSLKCCSKPLAHLRCMPASDGSRITRSHVPEQYPIELNSQFKANKLQ